MTRNRIFHTAISLLAASGTLALSGLSDAANAQQRSDQRQTSRVSELGILPIRGNVYLLHGAGANITLSIGRDGVLLVDTGTAAMADDVVATVQELAQRLVASATAVQPCLGVGCGAGPAFPSHLVTTASPPPPPPIRYIVNTNADADHAGGNIEVGQAGTTIGTGPGVRQFQAEFTGSAAIYAHEQALARLAGAGVPSTGWPTDAFSDNSKLYLNGEGIQLIHLPAAHTDGDVIVHFRGSDVISTGDLYSTTSYPVIDLERGGSIDGYIDALNRLLDLVIPEYQTEGGTLLIPGHGRVSDAADVATYRDAMTIVRDRIEIMIERRMTLEEIMAARPTKPYDTRYETPQWTKEAFIEAVYRSLTGD